MPKVMHIISGLKVGGAEMMLQRLIISAHGGRYEHLVVSLDPVGEMRHRFEEAGVELVIFDFKRSPIAHFIRLISLIRRVKPDIVQSWLYHADLLGGTAACLAGAYPVVWNIRSTAIPQGALSVTFWLIRLCAVCSYFVPDRILCCANSAKAAHIKLRYAAHKMIVVPNGFEFSLFERNLDIRTKARRELGFGERDTVIGVVGRFDPLKDFHNFVTAASYLVAKCGAVKFLMVGRGNEWSNPALRGWIERAGLVKNVYLVGQQTDVAYFLSAMDIFCLSSVNEAFPNVVVEAMAMGLPCVVTRAGDAADILGDDRFVVPVTDSVSLADALQRMCNFNSVVRRTLGERNAKKVREEYDIKKVRQKYEELYDQVSGRMNRTQFNNLDAKTVDGFGDEWSRFDQTGMSDEDAKRLFDGYFSIFPWSDLPKDAVGFDLGCGSGRWAKLVAPRVGKLHCIDPSVAIEVSRKNLRTLANCEFHQAGVDDIPISDRSMDFGYSLGVLHHIPDTHTALAACVSKLKPGAPFLLYLYYAFDNRPVWFRMLWQVSDWVRRAVSHMPHSLRYAMSQVIAALVYWPLARSAKLAENLGVNVENFPLAPYRNCGFYVMRTDALDRFGTRLEQRFTKLEIKKMMESAGLVRIRFSEENPFWCAVGYAKADF